MDAMHIAPTRVRWPVARLWHPDSLGERWQTRSSSLQIDKEAENWRHGCPLQYMIAYIYIYHKKDRKGAGRVQSCKQSRNHDKHQTANSYVPTKCLMLLLTSPGQNWFEWNALCIGHLLAFVWKLGTNCRMRNFPLVPSGWEKLRPLP